MITLLTKCILKVVHLKQLILNLQKDVIKKKALVKKKQMRTDKEIITEIENIIVKDNCTYSLKTLCPRLRKYSRLQQNWRPPPVGQI